jgi:hypothetical protein
MPWNESTGDVIGRCVNHVVGAGCKACVWCAPKILGGPGRNRSGPRMPDSISWQSFNMAFQNLAFTPDKNWWWSLYRQ